MKTISSEEILKIDHALASIRTELLRATELHKPMRGPHEGYGVIMEEFREFEDEIRSNDSKNQIKEVTQLGAMCARFIVDSESFT